MFSAAMQITTTTLALGANIPGKWGTPMDTMHRVVEEIKLLGYRVQSCSRIIRSTPMGMRRQPDFCNAVVAVEARVGTAALLRSMKRLERAAGRRPGPRWGPRPLDIDILTHGGRTIGFGTRRTKPGSLLLPHPNLAERTFVLEPMSEIAPHWRHPATGRTVREMRLTLRQPRRVANHVAIAKRRPAWQK